MVATTTRRLSVANAAANSCTDGDDGGAVAVGRTRRRREETSSPPGQVWQVEARGPTTNGGNVGAWWKLRTGAERVSGPAAEVARTPCQSLCSGGESSRLGQRTRIFVVSSEEEEPFVVVVDFLGCIVFSVGESGVLSLDAGDLKFSGGAEEDNGGEHCSQAPDSPSPVRMWSMAGSSIDPS